MPTSCPACRTELAPPAGGSGLAACAKCGLPHFFGDPASPFELLGVAKSIDLDAKALEGRYYELSKQLHPDRFAASGTSARMKSQELAAHLNQAYLSLRHPEARLEALLRDAGALKTDPKAAERSVQQAQIPTELAEEYFELQEAAMEDEERATVLLADFRAKLEARKRELEAELLERARKVDWSRLPAPAGAPDAPGARQEIEKILELRRQRSYVRSMFENLERLGLANG